MQNTPKEWSLIDRIRNRVQRQNDHTKVPLGDDAFVFKNFPGYSVICQDMMVEDVHFSLSYCQAFDLGYKSLAVNLSDIAAMGAQPHFAQVSLALPKKLNESWLDEFYKGMTSLADKFHLQIAGGDLAASPDRLVIDVSVHGSCEQPLTRKGAQPGDLLLCSGPLGLSLTGMTALQKEVPGFHEAKVRHLRPHPRLDLVPALQENHLQIKALMDCSDGLINDALLLRPEGGGIQLFAEKIPLHPESLLLADQLQLNALDIALWGGEDYELLMSVHPENSKHFPEWKIIGQFTKDPGVFVAHPDHLEEIKEFKGWNHFTT